MNLLIFGPQGSGKGTQSELLAKRFNLAHIEAGQLLRTAVKQQNDLGKKLNEIINIKKELVPDKVIGEVIEHALKTVPKNQGIILDGMPRRQSQVEMAEHILEVLDRNIDACIYLDISEAESLKRIAHRYACMDCGHKIVVGRDIPAGESHCAFCGGNIEQRADDTPEGIKKRLEIFHRDTQPVIEYYRGLEKLVDIQGEQSIEEVFKDIETALKEREII